MITAFEEDFRKVRVQYDWKALDKNLRYLVLFIRKRVRKDWDLVISVTGEEGSGKSSFACLFGSLIDRKFNLVDNMAFLPDEKEIVKGYTMLRKYQCYVIDEAIRAFYKMSFMTTMTQTLVRMWATERYQNKITMLVIPRFTDLVENFRNHRVKVWIHIIGRGRGIVYIRDDDPHNSDPWNIKSAQAYKSSIAKRKNASLLTMEERINIERKMKNYLFDFSFPDLDNEFKRVYQKMKIASRKELEKQSATEEEKEEGTQITQLRTQRDELIYSMVKENDIPQKEIQLKFNLTQKQLKGILDKVHNKKLLKEQEKKTFEDNTGLHTMLDKALEYEEQKSKLGGD